MKKSKIAIGIAEAFAVIVLVICVLLLSKDKTGPVITIPSDIKYKSGMTDKELLVGVTAVDNKDGDVSDTLIVKSVIELTKGNSVKITYAAQDSHNNVSEKSITLTYGGNVNAEKPSEPESAPQETPSEGDSSSDNSNEASSDAPNETPGSNTGETTSGYPEETTPVETVSPEAPVLYLVKIEDWIPRGSEVNWIKYVDDITDDKDERNTLFQSIMIDNYPDMNTVGDYDMSYYCKDSDGNFSPKVILHIHITE